ncbi:PREDICTED: basic salivary proline-rich protein 4-like [Cyprinodon variegatus]|uniref:basic salivary proline-rich protein 4-like n=1 Tax=Cyprinodon variegatus TaxID=28743 RepID=UPI00074283F5|nr:PREDICTED: basic salivary proline-rich protein 4-like [Cyprinodon variegatus]
MLNSGFEEPKRRPLPLQNTEASTRGLKAPDAQRDHKSKGTQEGQPTKSNPPPKEEERQPRGSLPATAMSEPPGAPGMSPRALPAGSHPEEDPAMGPRDPRPQGRPTPQGEPQSGPGGPGPVGQPPGIRQYAPGHPPPNTGETRRQQAPRPHSTPVAPAGLDSHSYTDPDPNQHTPQNPNPLCRGTRPWTTHPKDPQTYPGPTQRQPSYQASNPRPPPRNPPKSRTPWGIPGPSLMEATDSGVSSAGHL